MRLTLIWISKDVIIECFSFDVEGESLVFFIDVDSDFSFSLHKVIREDSLSFELLNAIRVESDIIDLLDDLILSFNLKQLTSFVMFEHEGHFYIVKEHQKKFSPVDLLQDQVRTLVQAFCSSSERKLTRASHR